MKELQVLFCNVNVFGLLCLKNSY